MFCFQFDTNMAPIPKTKWENYLNQEKILKTKGNLTFKKNSP